MSNITLAGATLSEAFDKGKKGYVATIPSVGKAFFVEGNKTHVALVIQEKVAMSADTYPNIDGDPIEYNPIFYKGKKAVVRGTSVKVETIKKDIEEGLSIEDLCEINGMTVEQINAALNFKGD